MPVHQYDLSVNNLNLLLASQTYDNRQEKRKVYAARRHIRSLCTQRQPGDAKAHENFNKLTCLEGYLSYTKCME